MLKEEECIAMPRAMLHTLVSFGEENKKKKKTEKKLMTFFKKLSNGRGLPIAKLRLLWYRII